MNRFFKNILVALFAVSFAFISCDEQKVAVSGIKIVPEEKTVKVDETFDVMVMITPDNATNAKYTLVVEDPSVISLEGNKVKALAVGETNIVARSEDGGLTATCKVVVTEEPVIAVTGIRISPQEQTMKVGDSFDVEVTVTPSNASNTQYRLSVEDPSVVSLDGNNVVALAPGETNIVATTEDGDFSASCKVTVKDGSEPLPDAGYKMTVLDVMADDIYISVDAPTDESEYFIWAEKESLIENYTSDELIDYTVETVFEEIKRALNYTRIDSVLGESGYRGDRDLIRIANVYTAYKAGGAAVTLRTLEPETRYIVYGFGVNHKTGEPTSSVFQLATATTSAEVEEGIVLKGTAANNIIVDINVTDENMPYLMFYRKTSEIADLTDEDIFAKDMNEDIYPAMDAYGIADVAEYINYFGMRGSIKGYNLLRNEYLEADTEYSVYFYGFDADGNRSTDIYRIDAKTDAVVQSGVSFEMSYDKDSNGKIINVNVVPSDENVWYRLHAVVDGKWGDYNPNVDPAQTAVNEFISGLIGAASVMDGYSMTLESYITGDGEPGMCIQGVYDDVVPNLNYMSGDTIYMVAFTVDEKTGVITSDPVTVVME